jgi:chaperonin GroES
MKIRPLHDRVIVKREEEERKSAGGIVIPDTAAEKPTFGKVVAVGKGKILENGEIRPIDLKVGDRILFGKYSGTEVKMDGDELVVMREEDVMAVVEGKYALRPTVPNRIQIEVSANGSKRRTLQRRRPATHVQGCECSGECRQGNARS